MSGGQTCNKLAIAVYRGLQKWASTHKDIPVAFVSGDVYSCAPELRAVSFDMNSATSVQKIARIAFKSRKLLKDEAAEDAVHSGLLALRLLNTTYAQQISLMQNTREDKQNRDGISYDVGTVFIHKRYGYRGLVYGWDRECQRDDDWVKQAGVDPGQPFYSVLPDEADCMRLFGQPLSTRYVAQDNMLPLKGDRILHRALNHFFSGHSAALGRYIPSPKLQYQYPAKYSADDGDTVEGDSNLLLHGEEEEGLREQQNWESAREERSSSQRYRSSGRAAGVWAEQEATI